MTPIYATSNSMGEVSRAKVLNALPLFFFSHGEYDDDDDDDNHGSGGDDCVDTVRNLFLLCFRF